MYSSHVQIKYGNERGSECNELKSVDRAGWTRT